MQCDKDGRRFESFTRERPYELGAGVDFEEGLVRFSTAVPCFADVAFDRVGAILLEKMEKQLPVLESWSQQSLKTQGDRIPLRGPSGYAYRKPARPDA